jgi:hypothetical protein
VFQPDANPDTDAGPDTDAEPDCPLSSHAAADDRATDFEP